jgi:two-component system, OmpR family, response regulator
MPDTSQEKRYQYRGDLQQTALPEMLHTIDLHRVPGVIEARHGSVVKKVYVRDGAVTYASSSDPGDTLGAYLQRVGHISREQYEATMRLRKEGDRRHGELLIDEGVLAPEQLYGALQEQVRSIVWGLFSWREGEVTFSIGDFAEEHMIRIHLPMRQVILQGIKRVPDAKSLVGRLGRKEAVFEPTWRTEELVEAALTAQELELLKMVDGKRVLYELCTEGPFAPAENARLLYAFRVLRLIRRREPQTPSSGVVKIRFRNPS